MAYRFLEDIATADVAFEAAAATREELFAQCAEALLATMVASPGDVGRHETLNVTLEHDELDLLLFAFLGELVYCKDAQRLLLHAAQVTIVGSTGSFRLEAVLCGERIDPARHRLLVDVKAVTLHRLQVAQAADEWRATVVLDI